MHLTGIDIHQLPGIDAITLNDFRAGINFIVGPNAIGKSSLIRALHYLLGEPRPGDPLALSIAARFDDDGTEWQALRNGANRRWLRDGEPAEPPTLPDADALHCYWLRAETLIAADEDDEQALQRRLREALAGGIDLHRVRAEAGIVVPAFPQNERREWQQARDRRRHTEQHYQALERQREQLPVLEQSLHEAREARDELERLRALRRLREAIDQRRALQAHLEAFPAVMQALEGNEADTLEHHEKAIEALHSEMAALERDRARLTASLAATGMAEKRPERRLVRECRTRLESLREGEQSRRHTAEALASARAEVDQASAALNAEAQALPPFDPATTEAIGDALRAYREARQWQAKVATPGLVNGRRQLLALIGLSAAGGGLSFISGALDNAWLALAGGGLAIIAALAAALYAGRRTPAGADIEAGVAAARERLDALRRANGLDELDCEDLGLERLLGLLERLDRARVDEKRQAARLASQDAQLDAERQALAERLGAWLDLPAMDSAALRAAVETLAERLDEARERRLEVDELDRRWQRLATERETHQQARAALFERARLNPGDHAGLAARLEAHTRYTQTRRELGEARFAEAQLRAPLAEHPALVDWAESSDTAAIDTAIDTQAGKAARLEPLAREIAELRATIERAGDDDALAGAIATEAEIAASLADKSAARMQAALGDWLLGEIEAEYRVHHEPGLIRDARERFEAFTHQQWSLEVDDHHQLLARDLRASRRRPLTALSAGTRMQLLLAARIAWARDQEAGGPALPLALDEALTSSDAERFAAAARNLEALARQEKRQILYLSARREDAVLWEQATGRAPHCIDLGAARAASAILPAAVTPEPPAQPPAPQGLTASDYARRLAVPAIDRRAEADAMHLFHILQDDLEGLHYLLGQWRLAELGPLGRWLTTPAGRARRDELGSGATLEARVMIARTWHALASQGLGQRLDRAVIAATGAFGPKMLERVQDTAERLDNDAEALIAALRDQAVAGLAQTRVGRFETWLEAQGYLDRRPRLGAEAIRRELLDRLGHRCEPDLIQRLCSWLAAGAEPPL